MSCLITKTSKGIHYQRLFSPKTAKQTQCVHVSLEDNAFASCGSTVSGYTTRWIYEGAEIRVNVCNWLKIVVYQVEEDCKESP